MNRINNLGKYAKKGNIPWNKGIDGRPICIQCGAKRTYASKAKCKTCAFPKREKGKCIDCNVQLKSFYTKKCKSCMHKGRSGLKGERNGMWKGGFGNCPDCGKKLTLAIRRIKTGKCRACALQDFFKLKEPTSIEKVVYDYLVSNGIIFEKQKLINGKFIVDAYIPSMNLIIEADGKYWHTLPKTVKKDKAENAYLTKCGFNLLRLTETEINNGSFKERLVS